MSRNKSPLPFGSNYEHVEQELEWLRARCARIAAQAKVREVEVEEADPTFTVRPGRSDARMAKCAVIQAQQEEDRLRTEIDARLRVHRATANTANLGLLQVVRDHGLGEDERTVLLVALVHALGSTFEDRIFGAVLPPTYGGPDVSDMVRILDPDGLEGHVQARSLFRPSSALMRSGLVVLDDARPGVRSADLLNGLGVKLTLRGFAAIMLDEGVLTEGATPSVTNGH